MGIPVTDPFGGRTVDFQFDPDAPNIVIEGNSGKRIPMIDGNRHWEAIKRWVARGNTIEAATQFVDRKDRKVAKVARYRHARLAALTVMVGGKEFPADPDTAAYVALIQSAVNAGLSLPANFSVRTVPGQKIAIDAAQLRTLSAQIALAQHTAIENVWNKVDQIKAAQSDGDLDAVTLGP